LHLAIEIIPDFVDSLVNHLPWTNLDHRPSAAQAWRCEHRFTSGNQPKDHQGSNDDWSQSGQ